MTSQAQAIPHSSKRVYHNATYILPADTDEWDRLHRQHLNILESYGTAILGSYSPAAGDRILDSGTGTGSWPVTVASETPEGVELFGLDISDRLFPTGPASERINFSRKSITDNPEDDWLGTFSLVHQRLLIGGLRDDEWLIAISHMHSLLKDGGYVQLGEFGLIKGGPFMDRFNTIFDGLSAGRHLLRSAMVEIPSMLRKVGFHDLLELQQFFPLGGWAGPLGKRDLELWLLMARSLKTPVLNAGGLGVVSSEAEFDELMEELERECESTEGCGVEFTYFVARK